MLYTGEDVHVNRARADAANLIPDAKLSCYAFRMQVPQQSSQDHAADDAMNRPASLTDLFFSFTWLALQGFGGVLAVVQRELVEHKRWMTQQTFAEEWAVAQIMPGPNVINLAMMIGGRYFGLAGALSALAGMLLVPLVIVLLLAVFYARYATHPEVAGALHGMSAVSAGLIAASGLKMLRTLKSLPLSLTISGLICIASFVCAAFFKLPLILVLLVFGFPVCLLIFRKLGSGAAHKTDPQKKIS